MKSASQLIKSKGLSVTAQRLAVYDAVEARPHGTAEEIISAVRKVLGGVSRQSVYNVLGAMSEHGILRKIQPAGSPARYESRVADNHHHLICRQCGETADVDCAVGEAPCLDLADNAGYVVDEAEVIYWGLCPSCQSK